MGAMRVQNSGKSHFGEQRGADFLFGGIWACTESETPWTGRSETAPGVWTICRLTDKTVGYETLQSMERLILLSKASDHVVYPTVLAVRGANPEGIASLSPGLRAARYLGCVSPSTPPTLKGEWHLLKLILPYKTPQKPNDSRTRWPYVSAIPLKGLYRFSPFTAGNSTLENDSQIVVQFFP